MSAAGARVPALRGLVGWAAGLRVPFVARGLRDPRHVVAAQAAALRGLVPRLARTHFGRACGLGAGADYAEFRARAPLHTYERLAPWIERAKRGEADVLWPGRCEYFAVSSGTTAGRTKYLPITRGMLAHFRRAGLDSLSYYAARAGHARVFRGRHLFLGGSTELVRLPESGAHAAWAGDLSGLTALHLPRWVEQHLYEPGREIAQMADWPVKLRAIATRTATRDITLLAGIPSWLLVFAETMRAHTGASPLQAIWPNLECLVHGGVPLGPFAGELRAAVGAGVALHEVYPASEGFIAAQDAEPEAGLRLIADAGIFYEFLPLRWFDETRLDALGEGAVPLEGVRAGEDYVLVMTTPAGLCRYVIGDVVRFVSVTPPRLVYVGRTRLQLSAFGEHVIERELTDALAEVAAAQWATVANFHVAPLFAGAVPGAARGRHEWWIELKPGGGAPADAAALAGALDLALQRRNDDYEAKRCGGGLAAPLARLVAPGTFELWLRRRGKWGGQSKMPRCRGDRDVARELAALHDAE
ncbi:MAG: hypothetical protein RLZZ15_1808 [Verrucomicrobiota bacterium]|jgi:hypothetical protein